MASRLLPRRQSSSLDGQRVEFEKVQTAHFTKAINSQELPVKIKHARGLIIGTHTDHSSRVFWSLAERVPLQDHPLTCWKFCHVLHKLLREGHRRTLPESSRQRALLRQQASFWSSLPEAYGRLIERYTAVLLCKLSFHDKYHGFPGSLAVTDDLLERIGENDANKFFEMAVDILDYLEEIVNVQTAVFGSLDMSRSSSMTKGGQCRLAPLIPCIQDSIELYNHAIKILFKLHSSLPPDLLSGHRQRFIKLFTPLKQFYAKSANLQYFKSLIQIPQLPDSPPNFFRACQLTDHVPSAVILPDEEDEGDLLIDTASQSNGSDRASDDLASIASVPAPPSAEEPMLRQELELLHQQLAATRQELGAARHELSTCRQELSGCRRQLSGCEQRAEQLQRLADERQAGEQAARQSTADADSKFTKMKTVYQQLREEHIGLIRGRAEGEQRLVQLQRELDRLNGQQQTSAAVSEQQLQDQNHRVAEIQTELETCRSRLVSAEGELLVCRTQTDSIRVERDDFQSRVAQLSTELDTQRQQSARTRDSVQLQIRGDVATTAADIIGRALEELDNPTFATVSCSPDYLVGISSSLLESVGEVSRCSDAGDVRGRLVFAHLLAQFILYGKATSHGSPDIRLGDEMAVCCQKLGRSALDWTAAQRQQLPAGEGDAGAAADDRAADVRQGVADVVGLAQRVTESLQAVSSGQIAGMIEQEMATMDKAIEAAANRIQEILSASRAADSGVQLEVNEKILDTCTALMEAVRQLVQRSRDLQAEIVAQGRGSATSGEFYKRNHRWTDGLISAAKSVALGARALLDSADKLVSGGGKFEEVIVATHEIAASSAQLVIASKVKADRHSTNLSSLGVASKGVSDATGSLVATVKSCMQMVEENASELDLAGLSLHQTKRQEMESQVRLLELESALVRERTQLAALRRQHYQLAGDLEGWEHVDNPA